MKPMKAKAVLFIVCLWTLAGCSNSNAPLPTLIPTAWVERTATPLPSLPATNTPVHVPEDEGVEAVLEEIDRETCQEAVKTQEELEGLQAQGQDVAELATAVAELIIELDNCDILLTPTPFDQ